MNWQPIETAPKDTFVLAVYEICGSKEVTIGKLIGEYWSDAYDCDIHPTHWMPLPDPPKEDNDAAS